MNKQASGRDCFVCGVGNGNGLGMKFYQVEPGLVISDYQVPDHFQGYPGVVHGGIIAAMLDEIAGRVFMSGDPPRFMFTVQLSLRYRKPVPTGKPLRLVGHAHKDKGRVAVGIGEIFDAEGNLLAEAEGVYADIPEEAREEFSAHSEFWKVYPDEEVTP